MRLVYKLKPSSIFHAPRNTTLYSRLEGQDQQHWLAFYASTFLKSIRCRKERTENNSTKNNLCAETLFATK